MQPSKSMLGDGPKFGTNEWMEKNWAYFMILTVHTRNPRLEIRNPKS